MALISLEQARSVVLSGCRPLAARPIPVPQALGTVLAEPVVAAEPIPPFANTAMDGYAVRAEDVARAPVELPVVGEVAAGHPASTPLRRGEAMRIFTGAPMPEGSDAVVMVEQTTRLDGGARVRIEGPAPPGQHVRRPGEDVDVGDVVFEPGAQLRAGHLGMLCSLGIGEVVAHPRPRVGVMSTGDELADGGGPLRPGQIRDSNRRTLLALVESEGWVAVDLGLARDLEEEIERRLDAAAQECDAVVTSGGVSMGDIDLVRVVLERLSAAAPGRDTGDMQWLQLSIKPAKPFAFGTIGERRVPVFGLPGNPVSSMVSFELLARPGLRRLAGHQDEALVRPAVAGVAAGPLPRRPDGKVHYVRVSVVVDETGRLMARSAGGQGSHQLAAMARANALAVLPDGSGVDAGEAVQLLLVAGVPAGPAA